MSGRSGSTGKYGSALRELYFAPPSIHVVYVEHIFETFSKVGQKPTFFLCKDGTMLEIAQTMPKPNSKQAIEQLQNEVETLLTPLGYEVVALELSSTPKEGRKVTLYIDFLSATSKKLISLDDCVAVNRAVDELFENTTLLEGHYNLEVSSPGIERPLRKPQDFLKFAGRRAKLHTFRPLESSELENLKYWEKNKKQKNFIGQLEGLSSDNLKVQFNIDGQQVFIPIELISKAHLVFENKGVKES